MVEHIMREENMEDSLAENDDSYIEIELDSSSSCAAMEVSPTTCVSSDEEEEEEEEEEEDDKINQDGHDGELKERQDDDGLRISISSRIALLDVDDDEEEQSVVVDCYEKTGDSSALVQAPPSPRRINSSADSEGGRRSKVDLWENGSLSSDHQTHVTLQTTTMPFNSPTRQSKEKEGSIKRRNGGTIMKMLIKFRGIKLSTLIPSLIKPPPPCQDHQNNNKGPTRKYCRTILQCYHQKKNMVVNPSSGSSPSSTSRRLSKPYWDLNNNINNSNEGSFRSTRRSSWNRSVVEIDLGALKGMFSAVGNGISQKGNSSNKRKSCSTISSCDNSPIHEGFSITCSTDNSIQAAIAYFKTSFGQTSDFTF